MVILVGCDSERFPEIACDQTFYYVSSAVCCESIMAAAIADEAGTIFIAENLFEYIDRSDVTIGKALQANYSIIANARELDPCGDLLTGKFIELSCFSVVD